MITNRKRWLANVSLLGASKLKEHPHYLYYLYLYYHLYLYKVFGASRSPLTTWPIPSPCVFQQNNELQMLRTARRCVCVYNTCAWNLKLFVCKAFHGSETSLFQQEQVSLWWTRWRIWELQNPKVRFKTQKLQSIIIAWVCPVQCDTRYTVTAHDNCLGHLCFSLYLCICAVCAVWSKIYSTWPLPVSQSVSCISY